MTGFFASVENVTEASAENVTEAGESQCGKRHYMRGIENVTTIYISGGDADAL